MINKYINKLSIIYTNKLLRRSYPSSILFTCFLVLTQSMDQMPADMVVNSILVSMAAQAGKQKEIIYHLGSSQKNPLKNEKLPEVAYQYFTTKPWTNKDGKPVRVRKIEILSSMPSFHRYMAIH